MRKKKFLSLILIFSMLFVITACTQNADKSKADNTTTISAESFSKIEDNDIETITANDIGGGVTGLTKYRSVYCDIPRPFANLVELYEFEEWHEGIIEIDPNETNEMTMKLFIQEFNISREEFDKANLEWTKIIIDGFKGEPVMNPQDFANQEINEVYNADIIYTFDDEIINEYYLSHDYPFVYITDYENAVANGTYQTRTTEWVDIEQMEAEIITKYGEAEIVTETQSPETETEGM